MRAAFRRDEVISRFGGDEFLVLSPDGDALAVRERASRINDILQGGEKEKPYWMGVCFGIEKASANDPRSDHSRSGPENVPAKRRQVGEAGLI